MDHINEGNKSIQRKERQSEDVDDQSDLISGLKIMYKQDFGTLNLAESEGQ